MSQTSGRWIDVPRVEGSTSDVKAQSPQEPPADQTTADAVCQARHRRRRVAQNPLLNYPRGKINRSTLPSQVIRFSGQTLRSLIPDCCSISLRGNRRRRGYGSSQTLPGAWSLRGRERCHRAMGAREPSRGASASLRRVLGTVGWAVAWRRGWGRPPHDVLSTGRGTRASKAVTRCSSALTGQELGRWRRIRSLYCLTCVATLKRVRITVEGWAWASAVCWSVWVRRA